MKCRYCGTENESSARFCRSCGKPMGPVPVNDGDNMYAGPGWVQRAQMSPEDAPEKSKWRKQILIAVVAIGVLLQSVIFCGQFNTCPSVPLPTPAFALV